MPDAFDPYHKWLGIPAQEQPPNHYRLLGLMLFEADLEVIESAADRQMAHVRSFQGGKHAAESQKLLNDLSAAKLCLLSAVKKTAYDQTLKTKLAPPQAATVQVAKRPTTAFAPAATPNKPPRVARVAAPLRPKPIESSPESSFGIEPLASSTAPRHRKRKPTSQQPALLVGAGAALVAVIGVVWALAGSSDGPPAQVSSKPSTPSDHVPSNPDRTGESKPPADHAADPKNVEPLAADDSQPIQQTADDLADESAETPSDEPAENVDKGTEIDAAGPPDDVMEPVMPDASGDADLDSTEPATAEPDAAPAKTPVPEADAIKAAIAEIQSLLKADFSAAKKPDQRIALAEKLLGLAKDSDVPIERYALLSEAQRWAASAGDSGLAMQAIDAQAEEFDVDRLDLAANMLDGLASKEMPAASRKLLVEVVMPLVDEAAAAGQFKLARRLAAVGLAVARKASATDAAKTLARQAHDLAAQEKLAEAADAARKQLAEKSDDADAHLTLGKYLCLVAGDWDTGLPHLKLGSDAALRSTAERELDGAETAADQVKLGDQWWDLADEQKGVEKDRYRARAGYWYEQAIGELTGLSKAKVEKRLAAIGDETPSKGTASRMSSGAKTAAQPRIGQWFDVLSIVDPAKQTLRGKWSYTVDGLLGETPRAPIQFPLTIDGSYELAVDFTRLNGDGLIGISFPIGATQAMLGISVDDGAESGIYEVNRGGAQANPSVVRPGSIESGKRYSVKVRVQQRGDDVSIDSTLDGRPYVHWRGPVKSLRPSSTWGTTQIHQPGLNMRHPTVFHSVKLKLLSGTAQVDAQVAGHPVRPAPVAARAGAKTSFLADLPAHDVRIFRDFAPPLSLKGTPSPHGVFLHPRSGNTSHAAYDLAARYQSLAGKACINDSAPNGSASPLTFRIVGDGRELWRSRPLQRANDVEDFRISVSGVRELELFVDCPDSEQWAHALWFDPKLTSAGGAGRTPPSIVSKAVTVGKSIDLLSLVDPVRQHLEPDWRRTAAGLHVEKREAKLPIPMSVQGDYSLHVEFTRQSGRDTVVVILPIASGQCMLALSGHDGAVTGFEVINGQELRGSSASIKPGTLENEHRYKLDVTVRRAGSKCTIETQLDGKPCVHWSGEITSLWLTPSWAIPRRDVIALGGNEPTDFHVAKFKLLSGTATIDADAVPQASLPVVAPARTSRPEQLKSDLMHGAVLIATFDEPTIIRQNGEVRVRDLSGKQKPGLLLGGSVVKGNAGQAIDLQKVGDIVDWGIDASLCPPALTACAWIKPAIQTSDLRDVLTKFDIRHASAGVALRLSSNKPEFAIVTGDGHWHYAAETAAQPVGEWVHLAGTYDDGGQRLYVNGRAAASKPSSGSVIPSDGQFLIGTSDGLPDRQFVGLIDEVALFDRALSADEIQQIYQLGKTGKSLTASAPVAKTPAAKTSPPEPSSRPKSAPAREPAKKVQSGKKTPGDLFKDAVLIATFDDPTIVRKKGEVSVRDLSGKQKPGRLVGATLVPGLVGRALNFNKIGDLVDFGDDPSLSPPALTACAWVQPAPNGGQWGDVLDKYHDILSKRLDEGGKSGFVLRLVWTIPEVEIGTGNGSWHTLRQPRELRMDEWVHVTATYDDTGQTLYVNGQSTCTQPSGGPIAVAPQRCYIGSTPGSKGGQFSGLIDEVALFNRALSAEEVQLIYQLGAKGKSLATGGKK